MFMPSGIPEIASPPAALGVSYCKYSLHRRTAGDLWEETRRTGKYIRIPDADANPRIESSHAQTKSLKERTAAEGDG
jgi:hypothetical protein